ncbi:MAG: putative teichuronic acid biosynthesis glycosyltransferase TuaH [Calditrichaeota bacterium]|nr:putative teichuronic acid biosynthesis glycosyltransferase TuaH [Calditrichota bacterium]
MQPTIAYVSQIRWPSEIPAGPFTAGYLSAIARAGVEAHLIVRSPDRYRGHSYDDATAVLRGEYDIDPPDNLHIHVLPTPSWRPANDRLVFFTRAGRLLGRLRRLHGVNTVMSRDTRALPFLARWRRRGFVAVHDSHNFYFDLAARDDISGKRAIRYQRYEREHLPLLDGLIALLETQAQWYARHLSIPIRALPPGVNRADPPDRSRLEKKTIGYVGSLSGIKGAEDVVRAYRELGREDVRLLLIGGRGAQETRRMRVRLAETGLLDRVDVTGWVSSEQLRHWLSQVSVAVLPLRDTFYNRYLTAPSKLFDYLGAALPVVASDLPAVRELAGDAAFYVPPGDRRALVRAFETLLADRNRHETLSAAAHERARELHWDRRGLATREFLAELLARRRLS